MTSRVYVASSSTIKFKAVEEYLYQAYSGQQRKEIISVAAEVTSDRTCTPQPIGLAEAFECAEMRLEGTLEALGKSVQNSGNNKTIPIIVLENYVEQFKGENDHPQNSSNIYVDRCLALVVCAFHRGAGISRLAATVPECYYEILTADVASLNKKSARVTIGERLSKNRAGVNAKDWFRATGHSFDRKQQLIDALGQAWTAFCAREDYRQYSDWPKKNVVFLDMFSPCVHDEGSRRIVSMMHAQIKAHLAVTWTDGAKKPIIAGLESRGLMLGFALSVLMGAPFIPLRKPGKLPGETLRQSFTKEYGEDVFEVQNDVVTNEHDVEREVIVIDDVLATGGSMEAACHLLERCGKHVALVVCLMDVPTLRSTWSVRLKKYKVALCSNDSYGF